MWHFAHLALRVFAGLTGLGLLYAALLLYEDEHGKIQNRLEEWWLRLSERQEAAISRHAAFVQGIARLTTRVLDRLFGPRLFSLRAFLVSFYCANATVCFINALTYAVAWWSPDAYQVEPLPLAPTNLQTAAFWFVCMLWEVLFALAPLWVVRRPRLMKAWLAYGVLCFLSWPFALRWLPDLRGDDVIAGGLALVLSFATDACFIALERWSLKVCSETKQVWKVAAAAAGNFGLLLAFITIPANFAIFCYSYYRYLSDFWERACVVAIELQKMNTVDGCISLIFIGLVLTVLAHRLFWPLINRPLYALQALGIARRRGLFGAIGVTLIGYAGLGIPESLKALFEKVGAM